MIMLKRLLLAALCAFVLQAALPTSAFAQAQKTMATSDSNPETEASDNQWHVSISPYLFFTGMNGTVGVAGHQTSVHVSASDVLSYLDLGAMGAVELRYNRLIIPVDFIWAKLSDDKGLPFDEGATNVKVKINEDIFTPKVGIRFVAKPRFTADAVFGARYWHLGSTLTIQGPELNDGHYASANWADAVAGAKFQAALTPKVMVTVLGDAGGGGAKSDYQIAGVLGFKVTKKWTLDAGYRYLSVNYRPTASTFIYDVTSSGVIIGATYRWK